MTDGKVNPLERVLAKMDKRECRYCGNVFVPHAIAQQYCNPEHMEKHAEERRKQKIYQARYNKKKKLGLPIDSKYSPTKYKKQIEPDMGQVKTNVKCHEILMDVCMELSNNNMNDKTISCICKLIKIVRILYMRDI